MRVNLTGSLAYSLMSYRRKNSVRRQLALLTAGLIFAFRALAAPEAELWERWTAHDAESTMVIDHEVWDGLLKKYIRPTAKGLNRFRYGAVTAADLWVLADYLAALQAERISGHNRSEQRAYWINLYNAATIKSVLEHYPVESIRDINLGGGFFTTGPWSEPFLKVEGESLSLDDIEHRILRPIWKNALIHYSVNCASVGCPNLARTAYTGGNAVRLAQANARAYVNSPRGAWFDEGDLYVSSIYAWFETDFGDSDAGVIAHLEQYAEPSLSKRLASVEEIGDDGYNWSLNDAR